MSESEQKTKEEFLKDCPCTVMFEDQELSNCCQGMFKHCGKKMAICGGVCLVIFVAIIVLTTATTVAFLG